MPVVAERAAEGAEEAGERRREGSRHRGKALFGLAITIALLWWALRDVSAGAVWREIERADPWWLAASVAVATGSFVVRAARWQILLLPGHPGVGFRSRFGSVCVGFMANNLLPARLGEFARAFSLSRSSRVGMSPAFGSIVVERVFDGLVLVAFLLVSLVVPGSPVGHGEGAERIRVTAAVGGAIFGLGLIFLWVLVRHPRRALHLIEKTLGRVLPGPLTDRTIELLASFVQGLGALHDPWIFLRALVWTVFLWLWLAASIWLGFLAFGIRAPGYPGAVLLQCLIGFAVAIPSSPGFFGLFEAAARFGLDFYGVPTARTIAFATGYHILSFIPVSLLGLWYVQRLGLTWSEVGRSEQIVENAVESGGTRLPDGP